MRRAKKPDANWMAVRDEVRRRASGLCEAGMDGCGHQGAQAHHIRRRSQGGLDAPENLLWVCQRCHEAIHASPMRAAEFGFLDLRKEA